jgi:hypothetical protein
MPTVDQERNQKTAVEMYGPWVGKHMHDTPTPVPSFIAHTLLVKVFRMPDEQAGVIVDELIKEARQKPNWEPTRKFNTHGATRWWMVQAAEADPATLFMITEYQHPGANT